MNTSGLPSPSVDPSICDLIEAIDGLAAVLAPHLDHAGISTIDEIAERVGLIAPITAEHRRYPRRSSPIEATSSGKRSIPLFHKLRHMPSATTLTIIGESRMDHRNHRHHKGSVVDLESDAHRAADSFTWLHLFVFGAMIGCWTASGWLLDLPRLLFPAMKTFRHLRRPALQNVDTGVVVR